MSCSLVPLGHSVIDHMRNIKWCQKSQLLFFFSHKKEKKKKIQTHGIYTALGELKKKRNTKSEIQDLYSSFD